MTSSESPPGQWPSTPWRARTSSPTAQRTSPWEQAAVVPISGGTALQAVTDAGGVAAGQKVLVTGVASSAKLDLVRALGADHVLDYNRDDFANGETRYDLIIDIAGLSGLARLRRALTPTGTLVLVGGEGGGDWSAAPWLGSSGPA